jgi:PQQ-like domain
MIVAIRIPKPTIRSVPERSRSLLAACATSLLLLACTASKQSVSPSPGDTGATSTPTTVDRLVVKSASYTLGAPIQRASAVRDGGKVLIAGGLDGGGATVGGVFVLDPTSGSLTNLGSLPKPVHDATGQMIGSRLFVFGGGVDSGTTSVQVFDPKAKTGSVVAHLPVSLSDLASAAVGGTIYLIGGYDGHIPRTEIYATTDGMTFSKAGSLPVGLRYPAVAAVGNDVIIAGGQRAGGPSADIYSFSATDGSVKRIGKLPGPVSEAGAFTINGIVYVTGGVGPGGAALASATAIDPATGLVTPQHPLPAPASDMSVAQGTDNSILVGGQSNGQTLDQVLVASVRTVILSPPPSTSSPTASPSLSADALARPFAGLLLIADRGNNQLLVMNVHKKIVWRYPAPGLPAPPHPLYFPDDAFWVHGGNAIIVNEEENNTVLEIAYPSGKTIWSYGHPKVSGSGPGYLFQPDDLYPYPGDGVVVADAKNCRILFIDANGFPSRQIGRTGDCTPGLPKTVGYPNGDTPLPNGNLLISELNGHRVDEVTRTGKVVWSLQVRGVVEPSDPQRLADGTYMVASYAMPGAVVRFNSNGKVLWYYHPTSGSGVLDHPSLAMPLPNGLVAVNDDYHHRVIFIDPKTNKIVWSYGTGVSGSGPGQLSFPDGIDLMLPGKVLPLHVDFASSEVHKGRP